MRFAYATPLTFEDYQEAIIEAWGQAESLFLESDRLAEEASRWEDRARTLEWELNNAVIID
jgi:hypothetical protein